MLSDHDRSPVRASATRRWSKRGWSATRTGFAAAAQPSSKARGRSSIRPRRTLFRTRPSPASSPEGVARTWGVVSVLSFFLIFSFFFLFLADRERSRAKLVSCRRPTSSGSPAACGLMRARSADRHAAIKRTATHRQFVFFRCIRGEAAGRLNTAAYSRTVRGALQHSRRYDRYGAGGSSTARESGAARGRAVVSNRRVRTVRKCCCAVSVCRPRT